MLHPLKRFIRSRTMSITEDLLLSFSGCPTLAEIEDIVLRDQGLTSMQVVQSLLAIPTYCRVRLTSAAGLAALSSTSVGVAGSQCIVAR